MPRPIFKTQQKINILHPVAYITLTREVEHKIELTCLSKHIYKKIHGKGKVAPVQAIKA